MLDLTRPLWRPLRRTRRGRRDAGEELRWIGGRTLTQRWYPQGIDTGTWHGRHILAVSWFRQGTDRRHLAARLTLVDLDRRAHLDVLLSVPAEDGMLAPAPIHAGGLAWCGDRLFVAATHDGLWEYDLRRVHRLHGAAARRVSGGGWRLTSALAVERVRVHPMPLRCSFVGRVFDDDGAEQRRVLVGEYSTGEHGRVGAFALPQDGSGFTPIDEEVPGITRLQGAVQWGSTRFLSQSAGARTPGTLWREERGAWQRSDALLPPGCEDLAIDPRTRLLWTLGEHPGHRVVRGIPLNRL